MLRRRGVCDLTQYNERAFCDRLRRYSILKGTQCVFVGNIFKNRETMYAKLFFARKTFFFMCAVFCVSSLICRSVSFCSKCVILGNKGAKTANIVIWKAVHRDDAVERTQYSYS